jgi:hypothetical protein
MRWTRGKKIDLYPEVDPAPSPSPEPDEEKISSLKLDDEPAQFPQNILPRTSLPEAARRSPSPSRLEAQISMPQRDVWLKPPKQHIRALSGRSARDGTLRKAEKHFQDDPEPIIVDYTLEVYEICR